MEWVLGLVETKRICHRVVEDPHGWWTPYSKDVDDLHQEVLIRIHRYLPLQERFDTTRDFFSWVKTIARTQYFSGKRNSEQRSEGREDLDGADAARDRELEIANASRQNEISGHVSSLDEVINSDLFQKLLAGLPTEDVQILTAVYCDELTYEEVGVLFGIGTHREKVRRRIVRILDRIYDNYISLAKKARIARQNDGYG